MLFNLEFCLWTLVLSIQQLQAAINMTELANFAALTYDVKNFYKSSTVVIIYDSPSDEWKFRESAFIIVRALTNRNVISQVITYATLNSTMNLEQEIQVIQPANPLFLLHIRNLDNLEFFNKLIRGRDISFFKWFVFIDDKSNFNCEDPQGNPFNLELDTKMIVKCENSPKIKKYFSVIENTTQVVDLALWRPDQGLELIDDDNLMQLKTNMKEITLRIAQLSEKSRVTKCLDDIISTLANFSNFKIEHTAEEKLFGVYDIATRQWTGVIKLMIEKKVDIAVALVIMSTDRLEVLDFTVPLIRSQRKFFLKLPDTAQLQWFAYLRVFHRDTWAAIIAFLLLFTILLTLVKSNFNRFINVNLFFENLLNVLGIYCQQGLSELPVNGPLQMLYFWIINFSLILYVIYSATITSYLSNLTAQLPFTNYSELLSDKTFQISILKGSRDETLVRTNDWLTSQLKDQLIKHDKLPKTSLDALLQVCKEKVAYYAPETVILGDYYPCNLGWLETPRFENLALTLMKNSPYTDTINYNILRLRNYGILSRIYSFHFHKVQEIPQKKLKEITISKIIPILFLWFVGVAISWIIFFLEILFHKKWF